MKFENRLVQEGCKLIQPYMFLDGKGSISANDNLDFSRIKIGISKLEEAVLIAPNDWRAYWFMGKGYQVLKNYEKAYESFKSAYEIQNENADVAREFMMACLDLGKSQEGVDLAEHAIRLRPNDSGLIANYALALLFNGEVEKAEEQVNKAFAMNPNDKITGSVKAVIIEVKTGKRPIPRKFSDIED